MDSLDCDHPDTSYYIDYVDSIYPLEVGMRTDLICRRSVSLRAMFGWFDSLTVGMN